VFEATGLDCRCGQQREYSSLDCRVDLGQLDKLLDLLRTFHHTVACGTEELLADPRIADLMDYQSECDIAFPKQSTP